MEITLPFRILQNTHISVVWAFFFLELGTVMQIRICLLYLFILCALGKQEI